MNALSKLYYVADIDISWLVITSQCILNEPRNKVNNLHAHDYYIDLFVKYDSKFFFFLNKHKKTQTHYTRMCMHKQIERQACKLCIYIYMYIYMYIYA